MSCDLSPVRKRSLLLLCFCLLGSLATASWAVEPPASRPEAPFLKPRPIDEVIDLRETLRQNGFDDRLDSFLTIQQFAQYGLKDRFLRYQKADQFDRSDIQKEMDAHQQKLAKQAFALRGMPVTIPDRGDVDAEGLAVVATLGLRLFRQGAVDGGIRSKSLASLRLCRANVREYWFLTKDNKMARCRSAAEVREVEKNDGFLYHPDVLVTNLGLILAVDREAAKQIGRNPQDYVMDIVIDDLRLHKPLEWGYYLRKALLESDFDCETLAEWNRTGVFLDPPDPHYFHVDATKQKPCVSSFLVAVNLRDKQGKSIASYLADKQYQPLLLDPAERVAVVLKALRNEGEKEKAALALIKMGSSAVPALLDALDEGDKGFRVSVLRILEQMGPRAAGAVSRLVRLKSDEKAAKEVRQAAGNALNKVADEKILAKIKANEALVASLTMALKDAKPSVRAKALADLASMGPEAVAAIPVLVESLADSNPVVRAQAATALAAIGSGAVSALADSLKSKNLWTRQGAVQALGLLGPAGTKAVSALIEALKDKNVLVRRGAAYALGRIGSGAKQALPALAAMTRDRDAQTRSIAAAAVLAIEAPPQPARRPRSR